LVIRIGDVKLNVIGFENIVGFKIDTVRVNRLLLATGIKKFTNNRISSSASKWRSMNSFANWSVRLGFVGARDFNTYSVGTYSGANRYYSSSAFMNRKKNEGFSTGYNNNNLVNKYGSGGILDNKALYSELILLDEFRKLNMEEKMLLTFNWRSKFKATSIAKTNKFSQFKFGVKVDLPLLTEFESFENIENDISKESFNKFVEQIIIFLNSLEDKKTYKITPLIKEVNTEGQVTVKTISTGIIIIVSKNINPLNLCEKLKFDINSCVQKYQLDFVSCEFGLIFKQWLTDDEFFGSFAKVEKVIDNMLTDSIKAIKTDDDKVLKDIQKRISINFLAVNFLI